MKMMLHMVKPTVNLRVKLLIRLAIIGLCLNAGEDSKTIISGLPKYSEEAAEYEECRSYSD